MWVFYVGFNFLGGFFMWVFLVGFFYLGFLGGFFICNPAQVALGGLALLAWSEDLSHDSRPRYEEQFCGAGMFSPDPNFFHSYSRIRVKEFKSFNPKNCFPALGNMIRVVHPGSGFLTIPDPVFRGQKGT
jgi:hypothetical protein